MKVILNEHGLLVGDPRLAQAAPGATFADCRSEEQLAEAAVGAEVCWGGRWLATLLAHGRELRWIASGSAGVEGYLEALAERPEIILTSGAGAFDIPIAEHVIGLLIALRRNLSANIRAQLEHRWNRVGTLGELHGTTLGIVGLGHIGRELARLASSGFGLRVLAYRREPGPSHPHVEQVFAGRDGLHAMLAECDQVAVTAALTPDTKGLLNAAALDCLPRHALVVNIARGAIIDQAALTARLADGRLAGAGLDVTSPEPLPPDNPLWDLPNVIITPHHAGSSTRTAERQSELFLTNLARYARGEPLLNRVDPRRGY